MLACLVTLGVPRDAFADKSAAEVPDQVLILRSNSTTKLKVLHTEGDLIARLIIYSPPPDALTILRQQVGPFVRKIDHESLEGSRLQLTLRLTTGAVKIRPYRIKAPPSWTVTFTTRKQINFPDRAKLIGQASGLLKIPHYPTLLPAPQRDHPCTGNQDGEAILRGPMRHFETELSFLELVGDIAEPICRSWASAQLAAAALENQKALDPFNRWAFSFAAETQPWPFFSREFGHASLIAAEILSRSRYIPEAELLLRDGSRYKPSDAPFRAMVLANHLSSLHKHDEAETLYAQLIKEGFEPLILYRASLARTLNALSGGDVLGVMKYVEIATRLLPTYKELPAILWNIGGEAALALGEIRLARKYFKRAARSQGYAQQGLATLRLGDLELRAGRRKSALQGWAISQAKGWRCSQQLVHFRRVLTLEKDISEVMNYLQSSKKFSSCREISVEAGFALVEIYLKRGDLQLALDAALDLQRLSSTPWGKLSPEHVLLTKIARASAEQHMRHLDPAGLVDFYENRLIEHAHAFDNRTRFLIGQAYADIGVGSRASIELLELLIDQPNIGFKHELLCELGEAFLLANDHYRASLVVRNLKTLNPPPSIRWRFHMLAAEYNRTVSRYETALKHLQLAESKLPPGDRMALANLSKAKVLSALGRTTSASKALKIASSSNRVTTEDLLAPSTSILSECIRNCTRDTLRSTLNRVLARIGRESLTPRLRVNLRRIGLLPQEKQPPDEKDTKEELWTRLAKVEAAAEAL